MADTCQKQTVTRVTGIYKEGVTSAGPVKIFKVPLGASVKIYPTSAGTATVYTTNTRDAVSSLDDTAAKIAASTNANWDAWTAGAVTAKSVTALTRPVEVVALTVASGTWTIEVTY